MKTKDLVYIALFAAMMAALGFFPPIVFPIIAIPITLQSLGPMLAGALLGPKKGPLSILLFCTLVAIGLPLLSGGRGGIAALVSPSAGFIYGWILAAFFIGFCYQRAFCKRGIAAQFIVMVFGGIVLVYALGIGWLSQIGNLTLSEAFLGMLIFIPGDLVKVSIALFVVRQLKKAGFFI